MNPNSKISSKTLSKMFEIPFSDNFTNEDIESAQLAYLYSGNCSIEHLLEFKSISFELVADSLVFLFDDPSLINRLVFPIQIFLNFIKSNDLDGIKVTKKLCELRENFYISLVYLICYVPNKSSVLNEKYLRDVATVLHFKSCWKVFERKEIWGLGRARSGFYTENDVLFLKLFFLEKIDITQVNPVINKIKGSNFKDFMDDGRNATFSSEILAYRFLYSGEQFSLPFFMQDAFSLINGFDPKIKMDNTIANENRNIINLIYEILYPLMLVPEIKENFCNLIKNVYAQDRKKLKFDPEINCGDSFCYTLFHILLKLGKGIFNSSFIDKIDVKKFPSLCFYYITRMMEISLLKLIEDIREDYNKDNSFYLIGHESKEILEYFKFLFTVLESRQDELYQPLLKCFNAKDENKNINENDPTVDSNVSKSFSQISIDNSMKDLKTFINEGTGLLEFKPLEILAESISEILNDPPFINTILTVYEFLLRAKTSESLILLKCIFSYRNIYTLQGLYVLVKTKPVIDQSLLNRLACLYSLKDENGIYDFRHALHELLKDYPLEINRDTQRMITFCISGMEDKISSIFNSIQQINSYEDKNKKFKSAFENNENEISLSEDEEKIELIPEKILDFLSKMNSVDLENFFKRKFENPGERLLEAQIQIQIRNNPYKIKLFKKIKVNEIRLERVKKALSSSGIYFFQLLKFIKSQAETSKKLFLNKNVFFRLFTVVNSALKLLLDDSSAKIKIANKQEYNLNFKDILSLVSQIIIAILRNNEKLIESSGLDLELVLKAIELTKSKDILNEFQLKELEKIKVVLENNKGEIIEEFEDLPDEFMDPLTFILMRDPVIMKTSNVTIDRSTFNQIMLNDQLDPFSRKEINENLIENDSELKEKIEMFILKKRSEKKTKKS